MSVHSLLKNSRIYLDGGMGTLLQKRGLKSGELPETWNLTHGEEIEEIHREYFNAGSNIVCANTFGANILKFGMSELEDIVKSAISHAKKAALSSVNSGEKYVALDIGPLGKLLKPYGDYDFEDAVNAFSVTVKLGVKYGADLVFIETMNDSYETKAAVLAAKENSTLPVFVSNAYGEDGKLMTGASPSAMVALLEGLNVDAVGANCSVGPDKLQGVVKELLEKASVPVIVKPNAGLPVFDGIDTHYDVSKERFALLMSEFCESGVRVVGGCCGTTPEYIRELKNKTEAIPVKEIIKKELTVISSYTHTVEFGKKPILIGERINPTGKKRFKQALLENDIGYILNEAVKQEERGVHVLDVNVGLPGIDEREVLTSSVCEIQSIVDLPLQIDTSSVLAMESALRRYNGKALVNSVNGKEESMSAVFPLVKKYGGVVVALTLDEKGIPNDADGRIRIAEKILKRAEDYGLDKKDIIFDTLAMAVSADSSSALTALNSLKYIRNVMGVNTSLGVSNISFGLPSRDTVNATFFAMALSNGLSAAIMNPYSEQMNGVYHSYLALSNNDENCLNYINYAQSIPERTVSVTPEKVASKPDITGESELKNAIIKGLSEYSAKACKALLNGNNALEIVNGEIIPALDKVGKGFEEKRVYLPQLLMSAEAAKSAFEVIKEHILSLGESQEKKCKIVIATVKGDIHDIGKNIVKVLLENYGFDVIDMGRDVDSELIVNKVVETHAYLVGLSALMTTTVPSMEECIKLLKNKAPWCKAVVGGAVLTEDYAKKIGADKYGKDAMDTVRYAEEINNSLKGL